MQKMPILVSDEILLTFTFIQCRNITFQDLNFWGFIKILKNY
jgi:hypothetical protein